jgi:hypothetical protein
MNAKPSGLSVVMEKRPFSSIFIAVPSLIRSSRSMSSGILAFVVRVELSRQRKYFLIFHRGSPLLFHSPTLIPAQAQRHIGQGQEIRCFSRGSTS